MSIFSFSIFSDAVQSRVRHHQVVTNETVFLEGGDVESIFFVETGCVRLVVFPQEDKQMVLYRARAGETFAEEHLTLDRYCYRAIADENTTLQSVPKSVLAADIEAHPLVAIRFMPA